jgi:hypothetical protein
MRVSVMAISFTAVDVDIDDVLRIEVEMDHI